MIIVQRIEPKEFWEWAYSDFLSNALRGVLAEYIVATALGGGCERGTHWDAYDLETPGSLTKIEVKSSAYLQSWDQEKHSVLSFDIAPKHAWNERTGKRSSKATRCADIYVFCVFSSQDRASAQPLDLDQWFFLACRSTFLNKEFKTQKTVALSVLEEYGLKRLPYEHLAAEIHALQK